MMKSTMENERGDEETVVCMPRGQTIINLYQKCPAPTKLHCRHVQGETSLDNIILKVAGTCQLNTPFLVKVIQMAP